MNKAITICGRHFLMVASGNKVQLLSDADNLRRVFFGNWSKYDRFVDRLRRKGGAV